MIGTFESLDFVMGFLETPSFSNLGFQCWKVIGSDSIYNDNYFLSAPCVSLRHLDSDLATVMKSAEEFDWNRVSFILEVGVIKQLMFKT